MKKIKFRLSKINKEYCKKLDSLINVINEISLAGQKHSNFCHSNGITPLILAIDWNNLNMVKHLKACGADVNFLDAHGWTPLGYAIDQNKPDLIRCLKACGADVNLHDADGNTPLVRAILKNKMGIAKLLEELGAKKPYAEEVVRIKLLAHVWGLKGTTSIAGQEVRLERMHPEYVVKQLSSFIKEFHMATPEGMPISETAKREIEEAFDHAYPLTSMSYADSISRIRSDKPYVILGGFSGHTISMVLFQGKLAVCNRGRGQKSQAVEIYDLPAAQVTEKLLQKLQKKYTTTTEFNQMIADLHLDLVDGYNQKKQKVGNCTWASGKGAYGVLCRMYTNDETGRMIYKKFTSFAREKELFDSVLSLISDHPRLLAKIRKKAANKEGLFAAKKFLGLSYGEKPKVAPSDSGE